MSLNHSTQSRSSPGTGGPDCAAEYIAGFSDAYDAEHFTARLTDVGIDRDAILTADKKQFLAFLYRHYAFNRAGGTGYNSLAREVLDDVGGVEPDVLWDTFQAECDRRGIGVNARVNRGAVKQAAECVDEHGNLFNWVGETVETTGTVSEAYETINSIRGFGDKISRFLIRDSVWVSGVETQIPQAETALLHPLDVWTRRIAKIIRTESWGMSDDEIAEVLAEHCDAAGVSHAEFNQGAWYMSAMVYDGESSDIVDALSDYL